MRDEDVAGVQPCALPIWATPLASSVTVPDPTEAPVQVLEAVKNVNVTVPVGVPKAPLTVALSCTVVPAGTEGTTLCLRQCITPPAVVVRTLTFSTSQGLSVPVVFRSPPLSAPPAGRWLRSSPL